MQSTFYRPIQSLLLIAILGFYGVRLTKNMAALSARPANEQAKIGNDQSYSFESDGGVDIYGNLVPSFTPSATSASVSFLIRASSLDSDMRFWEAVESQIPKAVNIKLLAYCDSNYCTEKLRTLHVSAGFPILQAAELMSAQALITADMSGNYILRKKKFPSPKRIRWRGLSITPQATAKELFQ